MHSVCFISEHTVHRSREVVGETAQLIRALTALPELGGVALNTTWRDPVTLAPEWGV